MDQKYPVTLVQEGLNHSNHLEVWQERVEEHQSPHHLVDQWRYVLDLLLLLIMSQPMPSTGQHGISITNAQQFPLSTRQVQFVLLR